MTRSIPIHALAIGLLAASAIARAAPDPLGGHLDPALIQTLLTRAQAAMAEGNISGARLLLGPVVAAGVPQAEYWMAETYDPVWLVKTHAMNVEGLADPMQAIRLYQLAAKHGDKDAASHIASEGQP